MSASLSIRAVDKIYRPRGRSPVHAVKALTMDVGRGEIVALLGSSGCGKTSTLRMVAGFEDVSDCGGVSSDCLKVLHHFVQSGGRDHPHP